MPELLKKIKGVEILPFLFAYIDIILYLCGGKKAHQLEALFDSGTLQQMLK